MYSRPSEGGVPRSGPVAAAPEAAEAARPKSKPPSIESPSRSRESSASSTAGSNGAPCKASTPCSTHSSLGCPRSKARWMRACANACTTPLRACAHRGSALFIVNMVGSPQAAPSKTAYKLGLSMLASKTVHTASTWLRLALGLGMRVGVGVGVRVRVRARWVQRVSRPPRQPSAAGAACASGRRGCQVRASASRNQGACAVVTARTVAKRPASASGGNKRLPREWSATQARSAARSAAAVACIESEEGYGSLSMEATAGVALVHRKRGITGAMKAEQHVIRRATTSTRYTMVESVVIASVSGTLRFLSKFESIPRTRAEPASMISGGCAVETEAGADTSEKMRASTSIFTPASTASSSEVVDLNEGIRSSGSSLEGAAFASARKAAIPASSSDTPPASRPDLGKPSISMLSACEVASR
eukprot:scaffold21223_cov64-Phaeocystis_antarctica.AAC.3